MQTKMPPTHVTVIYAFTAHSVKSCKMHTHTHIYIYTPVLKTQVRALDSVSIWKRIREKHDFNLNCHGLPKLAAFTPQLSNLAHSNHVNSSHVSFISNKNTLPVFMTSRLLFFVFVLCAWPVMWSCFSGITQILTLFHQIFFLADPQSTNNPFQDGSTCWWTAPGPFSSLTVVHTAIIWAGFSPLPYISLWSKACLLLLGSVSITAPSASSP